MKKVLFFIDSLNGGGAEKVLTDIVYNIDKSKYDITVLTYWDRGVYVEDIKKNSNITYKTCFKELKAGKSIFKKIYNMIIIKIRENIAKIFPKQFYNFIIKDDYDIEIAFIEGITTKVISYSTNKKSKKYAWVHIDLEKKNYVSKFYKNKEEQIKSYEKFDKIFCVSDDVRNSFTRVFGINNNIITQYNPVDEIKIRCLSTEKIDDVDINNKFKIITVGRLEPQKGFDRLLKIHKRLIEEGFDYELWILGEGIQKKQIEEFIKINKLCDSVKLLGFKKNPYKYMNKSDLFVCSSRTEGFSTVVTEALIIGLPVVSTKCTGTNELLNNGECGLITDNNIESLYMGVKEMLQNKKEYEKYRVKSLKRGKEFSLKRRINEIEKYL